MPVPLAGASASSLASASETTKSRPERSSPLFSAIGVASSRDVVSGKYVDMGAPRFDPAGIPLRAAAVSDSYPLMLSEGRVDVAALSMGNPHAVLTVPDCVDADVAGIGAQIEIHPDFPQRCNVGFMQVLAPDHIRLRVHERGVGETLACGTGACAAAVTGMRRGILERKVRVSLPGGDLTIEWPDSSASVWMTGPTQFVFEGEWHDD